METMNEKKANVLRIYDLPPEPYEAFYRELACWWTLAGCVHPIVLLIMVAALPFQLKNIRDMARARHLALTTDGLQFVVDAHPFSWRSSCCQKGTVTTTIPYDQILSVEVEEPAGTACCCCVERTLHNVLINTVTDPPFVCKRVGIDGMTPTPGINSLFRFDGGGFCGRFPTLFLEGVTEPHQLRVDLLAMKRGEGLAGVSSSQVVMQTVRVSGM